jgi:hypothetical protein
MFVDSESSPYARLRHALDRANLTQALAVAGDMPHLGLVEALELLLLLCDRAPEKYERAALRWHGRFCRETAGVTLVEGQAILALLAMLPVRREQAAHALSDVLYRRGRERACEALNAWALNARSIASSSRPARSQGRIL